MFLTPRMRWLAAMGLAAAGAVLGGCATPMYEPAPARDDPPYPVRIIRPVLAVTEFENRSNFAGQWHLGSGMADLMTTKLLASDRVTVLERERIDEIIGELVRQGNRLFRPEDRVPAGRLKNARYLARGAVTDFTVTHDATGWFGAADLKTWGRGQTARVAVNVQVSDVETGEIIASVRADATASAGWFGASANYKQYNFGGDAFYRTPLGRATEKAIERAIQRILKELPVRYWEPRVAEAGPAGIVVNGGLNVGLKAGQRFAARGEGRDITDPTSGDVIEHVPGPGRGKIELMEIRPGTAYARLLEGEVQRGDYLDLIP